MSYRELTELAQENDELKRKIEELESPPTPKAVVITVLVLIAIMVTVLFIGFAIGASLDQDESPEENRPILECLPPRPPQTYLDLRRWEQCMDLRERFYGDQP